MPDIDEKALLKMTPNKRWAARMNHAWHELKDKRPEDARFYTDYAPMQEVENPAKPGTVIRQRLHGCGRIQVWRPGTPPKKSKGAMLETYDGKPWHGFAEVVKQSTSYDECKASVIRLLSKFKG